MRRSLLLLLALPILCASTITGQFEVRGIFLLAAVSAPEGAAYEASDDFTRSSGDTDLDVNCTSPNSPCAWEEYCSSGNCYSTTTTILDEGPSGVTRRALNGTATSLAQYVAAQYVGAMGGAEAPGIVLRADDAGASPTGATDSHKFYVLRSNGGAYYEIRACRNVADCQTLALIDNIDLGDALANGDSIGLEVSEDTGNSIVFTAYKWTAQAAPSDYTLWSASAGAIWTVCASGCDQVWSVAPSSSTKGTADTGVRGGVYNGNTGGASAWDNWVFGETVVGPPPDPALGLSSLTVAASEVEGSVPTDGSVSVVNTGGLTLDWSATRTSVDDCNGATAGGADWVSLAETSGTGVTSGAPDQVIIEYSEACLNSESPHVATFEFTSAETTNDPITLTVTRTTSATGVAGSFPDNDPDVWGYKHPSCPSAATIEGTSCGSSASGGSTVQNCTISGGFTFTGTGDNITLSCVRWNAGSAVTRALFCTASDGGCEGTVITKITATGSGSNTGGGTGTDFINLASSYGTSGPHSMLIEKSVFQESRTSIILGGGKFDKDLSAIEPGYAFVWRENISRTREWGPGAHSEHVAIVETTDGALFENSVFDCDSTFSGSNPCNTSHFLIQPSNGASVSNITITGSRFIGDRGTPNGYEFTVNNNPSSPGSPTCVQNLTFADNVIEQFTTVGVVTGGTCGGLGDGTGAACSGNTVNGSAYSGGGCTP